MNIDSRFLLLLLWLIRVDNRLEYLDRFNEGNNNLLPLNGYFPLKFLLDVGESSVDFVYLVFGQSAQFADDILFADVAIS